MELQGPALLCIWIGLCPLLVPGLVTQQETAIRVAVDRSVLLKIPGCSLSNMDEVQWKKNRNAFLAKRKKTVIDNDSECGCALQENGDLLVHRAESSLYNVLVYHNDGKQKCNGSISVTAEEPVDGPRIESNCTAKNVVIRCSISAGTDPNVIILWNNHTKGNFKGKSHSVSINLKEQPGTVICVAKNTVSKEQQTKEINCSKGSLFNPDWDIYLILSIAGGCVAFVIFLILVIYLVKQRPCSNNRSIEEDGTPSYDRTQMNMQQRTLPIPPGPPIDVPDHSANQNPPAPHRQQAPTKSTARRGKQANQRHPPPQEQTDRVPGHHQTLTAQPSKPALPANHPNEQPPRPQPRTKSKAPRQHRKPP
ncbi:T-cell surface antigen CD2 isoform X2 [Pseudophryne corroboree]|uniref:T-cell surface antigen CD2 isoform X2 n=1 Tax=Pseudophryne corroboree TaxID=495146 RepID=UPI00308128D7